jgi:hypothetical protein
MVEQAFHCFHEGTPVRARNERRQRGSVRAAVLGDLQQHHELQALPPSLRRCEAVRPRGRGADAGPG